MSGGVLFLYQHAETSLCAAFYTIRAARPEYAPEVVLHAIPACYRSNTARVYPYYVLVKAPCECTTGIIERGLRSRDDNARGAAECVIDSRDRKPRSIIPVVYERERCFNWFVARFEPVKQEKARGNDGLRTAVHARILQRAVMDAAADALSESLGAVASELLLATENAADDPNFSISPENCARYGIY